MKMKNFSTANSLLVFVKLIMFIFYVHATSDDFEVPNTLNNIYPTVIDISNEANPGPASTREGIESNGLNKTSRVSDDNMHAQDSSGRMVPFNIEVPTSSTLSRPHHVKTIVENFSNPNNELNISGNQLTSLIKPDQTPINSQISHYPCPCPTEFREVKYKVWQELNNSKLLNQPSVYPFIFEEQPTNCYVFIMGSNDDFAACSIPVKVNNSEPILKKIKWNVVKHYGTDLQHFKLKMSLFGCKTGFRGDISILHNLNRALTESAKQIAILCDEISVSKCYSCISCLGIFRGLKHLAAFSQHMKGQKVFCILYQKKSKFIAKFYRQKDILKRKYKKEGQVIFQY